MTTTNASAAPLATAVGVLGATSLVAEPLIRMLSSRGGRVVACSRGGTPPVRSSGQRVTWCQPGTADPLGGPIPHWITACPLWAVPEHLPWLEALGIRSLVAVSSTSVDTRRNSPDPAERSIAARLGMAETALEEWATRCRTTLCLLRPTMIYDGKTDGTVAVVADFVRRRGFFPVAGPARGLRQPVHAGDVAAACVAAVDRAPLPQTVYTLSGPNPLPFCDLLAEVFKACGRRPRIIHLPRWSVPLLDSAARFAGYGSSLSGIASRMNEDLVFDHDAAARDLDFAPRPFSSATLSAEVLA